MNDFNINFPQNQRQHRTNCNVIAAAIPWLASKDTPTDIAAFWLFANMVEPGTESPSYTAGDGGYFVTSPMTSLSWWEEGQEAETTASDWESLQRYSRSHLLMTSLVLGVIILATIVGNVFVIAAIILERNLRNVANYLIASLTCLYQVIHIIFSPNFASLSQVSLRKLALQRRQLPDSVPGGRWFACCGAGHAAGSREWGQFALVPRQGLVWRVDVVRRSLLHVVDPSSGCHLAGSLLGRHPGGLHSQPVGRSYLAHGRSELGSVSSHLRSTAVRRRRPSARSRHYRHLCHQPQPRCIM